ncbi:MAG TPA: prephenate dehydrogenase [Spirochaetota bacterium]|nr:prephenate dehydrogenase [Spirochaetota bacterium]HPI89678.1 prephenate dehydrogenase [Spirochaetota bacterium]HPR49496.1 prephenate dehydrogenase [Spirochaetota bacterium]
MFKNIAVIGLGLLGGSLCKSIKKYIPDARVSAYGRDMAKLAPALNDGAVDEIGALDSISLEDRDLVVVCTPVVKSVEILRDLLQRPDLDTGAAVIDVGSVKNEIIRQTDDVARVGQFIACHPMAGSEKAGYAYSDADLYRDAWVIITPTEKNDRAMIDRVEKFWKVLGSKIIRTDAESHDEKVAHTSHFPHITACLMVKLLSDYDSGKKVSAISPFIGSGLKDMTRIASGSPDMWRDIVSMNRGNILKALDSFIDELETFKQRYLQSGDDLSALYDFFVTVKSIKEEMT